MRTIICTYDIEPKSYDLQTAASVSAVTLTDSGYVSNLSYEVMWYNDTMYRIYLSLLIDVSAVPRVHRMKPHSLSRRR